LGTRTIQTTQKIKIKKKKKKKKKLSLGIKGKYPPSHPVNESNSLVYIQEASEADEDMDTEGMI
jgi:hypothetical protein